MPPKKNYYFWDATLLYSANECTKGAVSERGSHIFKNFYSNDAGKPKAVLYRANLKPLILHKVVNLSERIHSIFGATDESHLSIDCESDFTSRYPLSDPSFNLFVRVESNTGNIFLKTLEHLQVNWCRIGAVSEMIKNLPFKWRRLRCVRCSHHSVCRRWFIHKTCSLLNLWHHLRKCCVQGRTQDFIKGGLRFR